MDISAKDLKKLVKTLFTLRKAIVKTHDMICSGFGVGGSDRMYELEDLVDSALGVVTKFDDNFEFFDLVNSLVTEKSFNKFWKKHYEGRI